MKPSFIPSKMEPSNLSIGLSSRFCHPCSYSLPAAQPAANIPALPQTYSEALRALATEVEQKKIIVQQRDEAIRTKALIGDKKVATAMSTASVPKRENKKLKNLLGEGETWKRVGVSSSSLTRQKL